MTEEYKFYEVKSAEIVVPGTYKHETYLAEFRKLVKGFKSCYVHEDVTSKVYPDASQRLVQGMHLRVTIMGIGATKPVRISKCMKYLIDEGTVFTNMHGLVLAFIECPDLFVDGFSYYGLDFPEMLPLYTVDVGNGHKRTGHRHPSINLPPTKHSFPRSISHTLTEKFGPLGRFLKFELI